VENNKNVVSIILFFSQVPSGPANGRDLETISNINHPAAHPNNDGIASMTAGVPVAADSSANSSAVDRSEAARTAVDDHVTQRRANEEDPCRSLECLSTLELERSCSKLSALQVKPTGSLAGGWI